MIADAAATPTPKLRAYCGNTGATKPNPMAMTNAAPTSTQISTGRAFDLLLTRQRLPDHLFRGGLHLRQVLGAVERLRVNLVLVLGAGRARGEPCVLGGDLQPAERCTVAPGPSEHRRDGLAADLLGLDQVRSQRRQPLFLFRGGRR